MTRARSYDRRGEGGQALVEFAIVAPLIVMVLLFAIWFYELIFVRLKTQEAARYAAWEATAYPLHDYSKDPPNDGSLTTTMQTSVIADTIARYSDLNSAKNGITSLVSQSPLLAATWAPPVPILTNASEEQAPGGWMPNLLLSIAGNLFDWLSALDYKNINPIATSLIGAGKDHGAALTTRMFGNSKWGFNTRGYIEARVGVRVTNNFFDRGVINGVGEFLVTHDSKSFFIWEKHGVLADSWRLDDGANVYGSTMSPGVSNTAFHKQVERMYLGKSAARAVAKTSATGLYALGNLALGLVQGASPKLTLDDFTRPVVVSKGYGSSGGGKVSISQDGRPSGSTSYDTAPATKSEGSSDLKEYGKTLDKRGQYFMGCGREMSLGCPSGTLQQDNPFGSYVVRE